LFAPLASAGADRAGTKGAGAEGAEANGAEAEGRAAASGKVVFTAAGGAAAPGCEAFRVLVWFVAAVAVIVVVVLVVQAVA
jgi:hypothetical protein